MRQGNEIFCNLSKILINSNKKSNFKQLITIEGHQTFTNASVAKNLNGA